MVVMLTAMLIVTHVRWRVLAQAQATAASVPSAVASQAAVPAPALNVVTQLAMSPPSVPSPSPASAGTTSQAAVPAPAVNAVTQLATSPASVPPPPPAGSGASVIAGAGDATATVSCALLWLTHRRCSRRHPVCVCVGVRQATTPSPPSRPDIAPVCVMLLCRVSRAALDVVRGSAVRGCCGGRLPLITVPARSVAMWSASSRRQA